MSISLPKAKIHALTRLAQNMLNRQRVTLRDLSRILGTMVAVYPAILPAPLHYRNLEKVRSMALRRDWAYETMVDVTQERRSDLRWWIANVNRHNGRALEITQWDLTIESDASKMGWGASCQGVRTEGPWSVQETSDTINYLELLAAFLALQTFASKLTRVAPVGQCHSNRLYQQNGWRSLGHSLPHCCRCLKCAFFCIHKQHTPERVWLARLQKLISSMTSSRRSSEPSLYDSLRHHRARWPPNEGTLAESGLSRGWTC